MQEIFDQIVVDSPQNALLVDDRICQQVLSLDVFPWVGRAGRISGTRELVIQRAPYIVVYRIEGAQVIIVHVLHAARLWPGAM